MISKSPTTLCAETLSGPRKVFQHKFALVLPEINIAKELLSVALFWNGLTLVQQRRRVFKQTHNAQGKSKSMKEYIKGQSHKVYPNIRDVRRAKITKEMLKINRRKSPFQGIICVARMDSDQAVSILYLATGRPHPPGQHTIYNVSCFNYGAVASAYSIILLMYIPSQWPSPYMYKIVGKLTGTRAGPPGLGHGRFRSKMISEINSGTISE